MSEFDTRIEAVAAARQATERTEEELYAVRLALQKVRSRLDRSNRGQTGRPAEHSEAALEARARVREAQEELTTLSRRLRESEDWIASFDARKRALDDLGTGERATEARLADLGAELDAAVAQLPGEDQKITELRARIEIAERALANLRESRPAAEADFEQLKAEERRRRRDARALAAETERARGTLRQAQEELAGHLRPEPGNADDLKEEERRLASSEKRLSRAYEVGRGRLHDLIDGLYVDPHPKGVVKWLNDAIPFLLVPVRIETIFVATANNVHELWVRVFPDEIAVQTHEAVLTDAEQEAGRLYWVELVIAAYLRSERERRQRDTWRSLVQLLSGPRAAWVAAQTKPSDWDAHAAGGDTQTLIALIKNADPTFFSGLRASALSPEAQAELDRVVAAEDSDAFIRLVEIQKWGEQLNALMRPLILGFPQADMTKTDAWTRAPRTRIMPDRFVLLLYRDLNAGPREIVGEAVPDVLTIGPDPLDAKKSFVDDAGGGVNFGEAFDWMSSFQKAVDQGMGFKVSLSQEEAANGFARICVLGVKASAAAAAGATMVENLIDSHQFSPKGFSIVRQGTPTNNSERDGSGYSDNDPYDDLAFFTQLDAGAFEPSSLDPRQSQTDGRHLADALGISYEPLLTVRNAHATDGLEARAMNIALFPATLGYWLHSWVAPVVPAATARLTRSFFNDYVTGRGPVPSIRIGDQPYGILVTSDLKRWNYPEGEWDRRLILFDEETPFLSGLRDLLRELEKLWTRIAGTLPFAGKAGLDPADLLMNVLGLQPTSAEFFQRIGYEDEYLRNLSAFKNKGRYANELASLMTSLPPTARTYLESLGITADLGDIAKMKSMHVLWQHYVSDLDPPNLVDGKPPSEGEGLAFNYIQKLADAATFDQIFKEELGGPAPSALLYLMLRNAILLQLHRGAYDWLEQRSTFNPDLVSALHETSLPNVRAGRPSLSRIEIMSASVGVVEPDHPLASATVADFIWRGFVNGDDEARYTSEQKEALGVLARSSTASLERAFVEHLDCCQYRLDAWETGLFAQRLLANRRAGSEDRSTGLYLGAFGWLEHVASAPRTFIQAQALPEALRPADQAPILEEDDVAGRPATTAGSRRGGFMHAPSLNHASAGAILRNAYLSHADPDRAELFSVNLSSERVRRANFVLDGMRQGQPIEALLGYQFERGLHDRTSASIARRDVPVLELNRFIQPYRTAFPFEARELPQAGDETPADKAVLYGVVDGMRLSAADLTAANGHGLASVLEAAKLPDAAQSAAILAEQDALLDTLDAVKDLLTAENAYQLVQGNFDRVAAVSLAQKEARIPPSLQVIDTPRGTEFSFTNRVTLHFEDLDPTLPETNPWPPIAMTPRALAEPGLNFWLAKVLGGSPAKILCTVSRKGGAGLDEVSLADLQLQPIDFVWLAGGQLDRNRGASELELRIARHYRRKHDVRDEELVTISFDPEAQGDRFAFSQLFPLVRQLRALLTEGRSLDARDFLPAPGSKEAGSLVDKTNEEGFDIAELRARVDLAFAGLSGLADALAGPAAPTIDLILLNEPGDPGDDETFSGPLADAFAKLEEAMLEFTDAARLTVNVLLSDVSTIAATLRGISAFGIEDAFVPETNLDEVAARAILARAQRVARRLRTEKKEGVLDRAAQLMTAAVAPLSTGQQGRMLLDAAALLFGETFRLMPAFSCHNGSDLAAAAADRNQLLKYALDQAAGTTERDLVDEWLQALARVRPQLKRWDDVRSLADVLSGQELGVLPAQVPHRTLDSWLAVEFPQKDPVDPAKPFGIASDTLSIAAHGATAVVQGVNQRGILIDEWTEDVPTSSETTGISFRFNRPNAEPPQTLLLAVTPDQNGSWDWDDLVGILADTLERAKRRAVEPAALEQQGGLWNVFAPALVSEFNAIGGSDISLDLALVKDFRPLTDFYSLGTKG